MPRHPGLTFEAVTPSLPETLPRMDVAAFVGFATRGPIDVPVPLEDVARFRDVFGPPLELERDIGAERTKTAHLGRAVKAFFRNGGRRCWVVRVAHRLGASSSAEPVRRTSFGLPGLVSAETGHLSTVRARCYGTTFDALRVGTALRRRLLPDPSAVEHAGDDVSKTLALSWGAGRRDPLLEDELTEGDLLRLSMDDGIVAFAPVASQTRVETNGDLGSDGSSLKVRTAPLHLFRRDPMPLREPVASGVAETEDGAEVRVTVEVQTPSGAADSFLDATLRRRIGAENRPVFRLLVDEKTEKDVSDLASQIVHVSGLNDGLVGWLQLGLGARGAGASAEVEVRDALWPISLDEAFGDATLPSVNTVERLWFDLLAWDDRELHTRLDRLGFAKAHPRTWTALPTDEDLFALQEGEAVAPLKGTFRADIFAPRFPLASPESPGEGPFVPLGMADRPASDRTRGRIPPEIDRSRLERERLPTFSTKVFVDSELDETSTAKLGKKADDKIYIDKQKATGLHSLWPIREVTLLAVPDAVHRGWDEPRQVSPTPASTPSPPDLEVDRDADPPVIHLAWSVERLEKEGVEVELQEATEPTFESPEIRYRGAASSVDRYVRSDESLTLFFRYRVVEFGQPGAWSKTCRVDLPAPDFTPCKGRPSIPGLELFRQRWLRWEPLEDLSEASESDGDSIETDDGFIEPDDEWLEYEIQIDRTPTFDAPSSKIGSVEVENTDEEEKVRLPLSTTPPNSTDLPRATKYYWYDGKPDATTPAVRYARVRARRSSVDQMLHGGWSNTVAIVRKLREETPLISPEEYDDPQSGAPGGGREGLLDVQRAVLRFAAARGDVLSVLALPKHDQPDDARRHVARLRTPGAALNYGEERTLSYGALYYPWLLDPVDDGAQLAPTPPDGAACGMIAERTLQDGAWTAPANIPLTAVRTIVPPLGMAGWADLNAQHINAFGETPRGVLTLGTATLARNSDLEPITTRRLLILVRRLVRREGPAFVFENNSPHLWRRIAEQFDAVLRRLFRRGAFAGATPAEGYRVVADDSVNPPEQVERGRLVVELRIAPAHPLKFLTVRLVQREGQPTAVNESGAGVPA